MTAEELPPHRRYRMQESGRRLVQDGFMRPYDGEAIWRWKSDRRWRYRRTADAALRPPQPVGRQNYTTDMAITSTLIRAGRAALKRLNDDYCRSVQVRFPRAPPRTPVRA